VENNDLAGEADAGNQNQPSAMNSKEPRQLIKAGFLMLTSDILGGLAFAIWNKHQIASMKENSVSNADKPLSGNDDAIY